jgi:hypothetical protein
LLFNTDPNSGFVHIHGYADESYEQIRGASFGRFVAAFRGGAWAEETTGHGFPSPR